MSTIFLQINTYLIDTSSGELRPFDSDLQTSLSYAAVDRLEPKSLQCLCTLTEFNNQIVDKSVLMEKVWPGQVVTDDALTRCISRLRKALNDQAKKPEIIETIPKRGYRFIAQIYITHEEKEQALKAVSHHEYSPSMPIVQKTKHSANHKIMLASVMLLVILAIVLGAVLVNEGQHELVVSENMPTLLDNADDHYFKIRRQDNEMAIELYKQVIALKPDSGLGQAGLANALVQQVVRWPNDAGTEDLRVKNLQHALSMPHINTQESQAKLNRALMLAKRATQASPKEARTYKALGFVHSAMGEFVLAREKYQTAVSLDPNAWDALLNIGDTLEIEGKLIEAIEYYERSFDAMTAIYKEQSSRVAPWYAEVGASIGDKYLSLDKLQDAEAWYRHTLTIAPFNANATSGLSKVLFMQGDTSNAESICEIYIKRIGEDICPFLKRKAS